MDYKALSEQLQKDCDAEHQRYLEVQENYSWRLCEVCEYLGIDNDDTSEKIIKEIKRDREEKKLLYEQLQAENEKLKKEAEEANEDADSLVEAYEKLAKKKLVEHFDAVKEVAKIRAENEKLKADVERLEKHREEIMEGHLEFNKKAGEFHRKKVAELQAEIEKLKAS